MMRGLLVAALLGLPACAGRTLDDDQGAVPYVGGINVAPDGALAEFSLGGYDNGIDLSCITFEGGCEIDDDCEVSSLSEEEKYSSAPGTSRSRDRTSWRR